MILRCFAFLLLYHKLIIWKACAVLLMTQEQCDKTRHEPRQWHQTTVLIIVFLNTRFSQLKKKKPPVSLKNILHENVNIINVIQCQPSSTSLSNILVAKREVHTDHFYYAPYGCLEERNMLLLELSLICVFGRHFLQSEQSGPVPSRKTADNICSQ